MLGFFPFTISVNNTLHYIVLCVINKEGVLTGLASHGCMCKAAGERGEGMEINKEILKGNIDTMILALLSEKDRYGYEIAKCVREKSENLFEIKEGTLYLSLKRLEKNGWIASYWGDESGPGGRRKYYTCTELGRAGFQRKKEEWRFVKKMMDLFLEGDV